MFFFFQAEDGIRDLTVTGVQTCALPISAADRVYVGYRSVACWRELVPDGVWGPNDTRSEEHTSELQSQSNLVCRLLLEKKKNNSQYHYYGEILEPHQTSHTASTVSRQLS